MSVLLSCLLLLVLQPFVKGSEICTLGACTPASEPPGSLNAVEIQSCWITRRISDTASDNKMNQTCKDLSKNSKSFDIIFLELIAL